MSIRQQQSSMIPHTEFILNFQDNPRRVYVDRNDLGLPEPKTFPVNYNGAHNNPWLCYDETLVKIRRDAANKLKCKWDEIKLYTDDKEMLNSQSLFSKQSTIKDESGHLWMRASNPHNKMNHIDTKNIYDRHVRLEDVKRFPQKNVRTTMGEKYAAFKGDANSLQKLKFIMDTYKKLFKNEECLPDILGMEIAEIYNMRDRIGNYEVELMHLQKIHKNAGIFTEDKMLDRIDNGNDYGFFKQPLIKEQKPLRATYNHHQIQPNVAHGGYHYPYHLF